MNEVVDRVPSQPGRYKMTMPDGSTQYVTLERADEPTVVGTPLNKALFDSIQDDLDELNSNKVKVSYQSVQVTLGTTSNASVIGGYYGTTDINVDVNIKIVVPLGCYLASNTGILGVATIIKPGGWGVAGGMQVRANGNVSGGVYNVPMAFFS